MPSRADANTKPRTYTPEDVVQQSLVAFGQGTNYLRVNAEAAQYVVDLMQATIERFRIQESWETEAVQVLERLRAIGRLAASYATQNGSTVITGEEVSRAAILVQRTSKTMICGSGGGSSAAFPASL